MSNGNAPNHKLRTKLILIYLIIVGLKLIKCEEINKEDDEDVATFLFPEFDYKETNKNEVAYHDIESNCELSVECEESVDVLGKAICTSKCVSSSCYREIYCFNELEDGEIDVRLLSFKGCFTQRVTKPSRMEELFNSLLEYLDRKVHMFSILYF